MNKLKYILVFASLLLVTVSGFARTVIDMAGRKVEVPEQLNRLLPYDVKTSILLFPCAGERMIAKGILPGTKSLPYLCDEYKNLPDVDIKSLEEVLNVRPDVIIAGAFLPDDSPERFNKLQSRTHIPVVMIDLSLGKLDQSYAFLGELLGIPATCKSYVDYLQSVYAKLENCMKTHPLGDLSVYYTLGGDGLMTDPSGSKHTEVLDYLKIPNAAKIPIPSGGHAQVNLEQVISWNPDYIFAACFKGNRNPAKEIAANAAWSSVKAVQQNKVFVVPGAPYGWFDHPPTVNRICGMIWLAEIFYNYPHSDAVADLRMFYKLFYQYDLSEADLRQMGYSL